MTSINSSQRSLHPHETINQVDLVANALNNKIIGRSAIDKINQAISVIDLREQSQKIDLGKEPESTQVLRLIINKVKPIFENISNYTPQDIISMFYLTKVIDFPQITDVFNRMLGIISSRKNSEKKTLVKDIAKLIPASLSENQLEADFSELIRQIDDGLLDPTLIEEKLHDIRKRNYTQKKLQEKGDELRRFQLTDPDNNNNNQLRVKSQLNPSQRIFFEGWNFFNDSPNQEREDSDILGNLCFRIQNNPELLDHIEQAKQSTKCTNNNILVFLGTTQVGKSSTLNFLSGQIPFIARGYLHKEDFTILDKGTDQKSATKNSEKVFSYLIDAGLIRLFSPSDSDSDEDVEDPQTDLDNNNSDNLRSPASRPQFYVPTFNIGERISSQTDNDDKKKLREFILENFPEKTEEFLFKFIVNQLEGAIRQKDRSEDERPGIGFKNPIFSYGVGISKTIVAQAKNQDWNTTTIDLPGSGESRGDEYSLLSAFSTYCALEQSTSVKGAAIILSYEQLRNEATTVEDLIKVFSSAKNMMGESIEPSNICILVTKVPLTKSRKGRMVPRPSDEIQELVAKELSKLCNLLAQNESPEHSRLKVLLLEIIKGERFIPVIPLRTMEDNDLEVSDPHNVNEENKDKIIKMFSNLSPIKVPTNYFSQTYSSQNGNIRGIIDQIEDSILSVSSVIKKELKSLKSLFKTLKEKQDQILIDIDVANHYIKEINECLVIEQKTFDEVMKNYLEGNGRHTNSFSLKQGSKMKAEEIKNLAIIAAKQEAIGEAKWFDRPYQSPTLSAILGLEKKLEEKKELISSLEEKIATLESQKKTDGKKDVTVQSSKLPPIDSYWYAGEQTATLETSKDYPVTPKHDLRATQGGFSITFNREDTKDKYRVKFVVTKKERAGIFSKYKMTCEVSLTASASDVIDHKIKVEQAKLKKLQDDLLSTAQRVETLRETEDLNQKVYNLEQDKQNIVYKTQQQYHESLAKLQNEFGIKDDKSQIMSMSDIRKLMIGVLVNNANRSLEEARLPLHEARTYFQKQDRLANIHKIKSAIKNYRTLDGLLFITKALNFESKYDNAVTVMSISEMEKAVDKMIVLEDIIKKVVIYLENCKPEIDMIQKQASKLKLDIDKYDQALERDFKESTSTCMIL